MGQAKGRSSKHQHMTPEALWRAHFRNVAGRSFKELAGDFGVPRSTLHALVQKEAGSHNPMSLLRALHQDYLDSPRYTAKQKREIEKWLWRNRTELTTSDRFMSQKQEQGAAMRECSPLQDWSSAFGSSLFHQDPDDDEEPARDWCPVVSRLTLETIANLLVSELESVLAA